MNHLEGEQWEDKKKTLLKIKRSVDALCKLYKLENFIANGIFWLRLGNSKNIIIG